MQADGCEIYALQQRRERLHLVTQHLHLAIANLGDRLKCCPRLLQQLITNCIQLDTRRDRFFSEAGNGGQSTQLAATSACSQSVRESFR